MVNPQEMRNKLQGVMKVLQLQQEINNILLEMIENGQITFTVKFEEE